MDTDKDATADSPKALWTSANIVTNSRSLRQPSLNKEGIRA